MQEKISLTTSSFFEYDFEYENKLIKLKELQSSMENIKIKYIYIYI